MCLTNIGDAGEVQTTLEMFLSFIINLDLPSQPENDMDSILCSKDIINKLSLLYKYFFKHLNYSLQDLLDSVSQFGNDTFKPVQIHKQILDHVQGKKINNDGWEISYSFRYLEKM